MLRSHFLLPLAALNNIVNESKIVYVSLNDFCSLRLYHKVNILKFNVERKEVSKYVAIFFAI